MRSVQGMFLCGLLVLAAGCGGADGPDLYEAGGTVTYKGQPVSNATVTVQPADGPIAIGRTDDEGRFTLATGGKPGVVAGPAKVSVTAVEGGEVSEAAKQEYERTGKMPQIPPAKSKIPTKYNQNATSGLEITVSDDESKNDFPLQLTD